MGGSNISRLINRYWAVTFFPVFLLGCVYADWSHTRQWKKEIAEQRRLELNN